MFWGRGKLSILIWIFVTSHEVLIYLSKACQHSLEPDIFMDDFLLAIIRPEIFGAGGTVAFGNLLAS